jgi:hypothetical protein
MNHSERRRSPEPTGGEGRGPFAPLGPRQTLRPQIADPREGGDISTRMIVIVLVVLLLLGALPTWPYSAGWGYYPSGGLVLLVLLLMGACTSPRVLAGERGGGLLGCSTQNVAWIGQTGLSLPSRRGVGLKNHRSRTFALER